MSLDEALHLSQPQHIDRNQKGVEREQRIKSLEKEIEGEKRIGDDRPDAQRDHGVRHIDEHARRGGEIADRFDRPIVILRDQMLQDHFKSNLARIFDMLAEGRAPARESGRHAGERSGGPGASDALRPTSRFATWARGAVALGPRNMEKFVKLVGVAAPLPIMNVDTDMIIPKQYLKTIQRTGLGKGLFSEMRYREDGSENPDFVLNLPAYRKASILVAGDNFGCGSSREHAPWALLDFGVRCVISTSFADIFYNNCFKNGILPIAVSQAELDKLMDDASRGANATLTIDLAAQEIRGPDGGVITFDIDPFRKHCLLNGLDDIGLTLQKADQIDAYEKRAAAKRPWA